MNNTVYNSQLACLHEAPKPACTFSPLVSFERAPNRKAQEAGKIALREGKVGSVILAGGQASRLGITTPKGMISVSPILHKSLFQIFAEKIIACNAQVERALSVACMTAAQNHDATNAFFQSHNFFGLPKDSLSFFMQSTLPFLDDAGKYIIGPDGIPLQGPDGNGSLFWNMESCGLLQAWEKQGIEHIVVICVDNPLADPFDAELIGSHILANRDITVKAIERIAMKRMAMKKTDPAEHLGIIVEQGKHLKVCEYFEVSEEIQNARDSTGALLFPFANISNFCFSLAFIRKFVTSKHTLPLHKAHKKPAPELPPAWKFEYFIFDILEESENAGVVVYDRSTCFAPLKNNDGPYSLKMVQEALLQNGIM